MNWICPRCKGIGEVQHMSGIWGVCPMCKGVSTEEEPEEEDAECTETDIQEEKES